MTQCVHRIDFRRAPSREITGDGCHREHQRRRGANAVWVSRRQSVEQAGNQSSRRRHVARAVEVGAASDRCRGDRGTRPLGPAAGGTARATADAACGPDR